jgi:uncharacterized protein YoxC
MDTLWLIGLLVFILLLIAIIYNQHQLNQSIKRYHEASDEFNSIVDGIIEKWQKEKDSNS